MRIAPPLALTLLSSIAASTAHASPEDLFGYGARSPAMAGTGAASSTDYEAAYTNPALLSLVRRNLLAVGFQGAAYRLVASGDRVPPSSPALPARGIVVGAGVPIPFGGVLANRIATGLAFYTPTDVLVRGRILYPETPDFAIVADRSQSLAVRLGVGADVGWGVRVGAGVAALAELVGSITIANAGGGTVGAHVDDQLVATYAPTFGASWETPGWRVGATWRGTIDARFGVAVDASKLSTIPIPVFNIAGLAQYDPAQAIVEVARDQGPWTLALGVTWKAWSRYPGTWEATIQCDDCAALTPPKVAFGDTIVPRLGVERRFALASRAVARLRAGFFFEPSPVPDSLASSQAYDVPSQGLIDEPTRLLDANRYVGTVGGGIDLGDAAPFTLDTWAQYHALAARTLATPPAPSASVSGHVLAWAIVAGVRF